MKKGFSFFLLSLLFITPGCKDSKEIVNEYNVVPLPNQMVPQQGRFDLNKKVKVITTGCSPEVQSNCRQSYQPTGYDSRYLIGADR